MTEAAETGPKQRIQGHINPPLPPAPSTWHGFTTEHMGEGNPFDGYQS